MSIPPCAPQSVYDHLASLPQRCVGELYATIRHPWGLKREYKVPAWGQLCDGRPHVSSVNCMLHNKFPNHGRGYTYVSWRAVPDNPEQNRYPRTGVVEKAIPFDGKTI